MWCIVDVESVISSSCEWIHLCSRFLLDYCAWLEFFFGKENSRLTFLNNINFETAFSTYTCKEKKKETESLLVENDLKNSFALFFYQTQVKDELFYLFVNFYLVNAIYFVSFVYSSSKWSWLFLSGICHPTSFWLWTCYSFCLFPFLPKGSHECHWLDRNHFGWYWYNRYVNSSWLLHRLVLISLLYSYFRMLTW